MITFSPIRANYSSNYSFKSKKTEASSNSNNQHKNNNNMPKVKTGALVTTALIAGLGIGNSFSADSKQTDDFNNIKIEQVDKNHISKQDLMNAINQPKKIYVEKDTVIGKNGKKQIKENYYTVSTKAILTSQVIKDLNTNETVQTANFSDYVYIPQKTTYKNHKENIKQDIRYNNFDFNTGTYKSTEKVVQYKDGSKDSTNISSPDLRITYEHIESPKVQLEKQQQKKRAQEQEDEEAMFREFMMN